MADTDYHGWPLPDGTDVPFVHLDIKALGDEIDKELPIVVADWTALQALPPILNLKAMVASQNYRLFTHNGTTWKPTHAGARNVTKDTVLVGGSGGSSSGLNAKVQSGEVQLIHQFGTVVVATDASGYIAHTYAEAFPNGVISAQVGNGDSSTGRGDTYSVAGTPFTQTASTLFISVTDGVGSAKGSSTVRFMYDVWGW